MNIIRIRELLDTIETAQTELATLVVAGGGTVNESGAIPPPQVQLDATTPHRKKRVCSICKKPGHDVRHCPNGKGMHPDNPRDEELKARALSSKEYFDMRAAMNDKDFQSTKYALVHKLSLKEVNWAVVAEDYGDYLEGRV